MECIHGYLFFNIEILMHIREGCKERTGAEIAFTPQFKELIGLEFLVVQSSDKTYSFVLFRTMSFSWLISCALYAIPPMPTPESPRPPKGIQSTRKAVWSLTITAVALSCLTACSATSMSFANTAA